VGHPGLIDAHPTWASTPRQRLANSDGNELTNPVTAEVWAEHSVWPQDGLQHRPHAASPPPDPAGPAI
jgi:hypothetical protein